MPSGYFESLISIIWLVAKPFAFPCRRVERAELVSRNVTAWPSLTDIGINCADVYRRMSAWLAMGESRVRRMWRALPINIPRRRLRRRRCGNDIHLPSATQSNSIWSYDFVHDQSGDERALKMLCVID